MVQQSTNNIFENMYKFNAKELDESTGYYYYGARYYDPAISIFLSVDPLAEQFPAWNPYHYVHNNPINLVDPTGMSAKDPSDQDPPTFRSPMEDHVSPADREEVEKYVKQLNEKPSVYGKVNQDGVAIYGNGADPMSGVIKDDRGSGSIDVGDADLNPFNAVLNKVMAYIGELFIGDKVREANTSKESTLPTTSKPEMEIIPLYEYKVAPPLGPRGSAAGATVQSRHVKDTMVEKGSSSSVLNRQQRIKSQKQHQADSINRSIRK